MRRDFHDEAMHAGGRAVTSQHHDDIADAAQLVTIRIENRCTS